MSSMIPKYRVVIKIGSVRYYASKGKRPLPWVDWDNCVTKTTKVQRFLKEEAMAIADKYNDQKPTIEKVPGAGAYKIKEHSG